MLDSLSTHTVPLAAVMVSLQLLFVGLIIPGVFALIKLLWGIRAHLANINGHVATLNQWRVDHEIAMAKDALAVEASHRATQQGNRDRFDELSRRLDLLGK